MSGPPATIRYTLDGSDPTATSTAYSAPVSVSTLTTVKAKAFPTNGWAASATTSETLTFNYGTLDLPSATPGAGVFATAPQVSLTSIAGASIRYTLDGTTPTGSSTLYTAAITTPANGATLKSIAFHQDWTASTVRTDTYIVDTVAPTITASSFPAAISGWHSLATTVSFICTDNVGIASCSGPSAFTTEGQAQTIVGTAVDLAGREATTNVTVNVDLTPPTLAMTSPTSQVTTANTSIAVEGEVSDQLSGLAMVTCNGETAAVVNGQVACDVALHPGINDIVLAARDTAGNSRSAAVRVIRTGTSNVLGLAPATQTLLVDETATLKLTDDFGASIEGATWESSDTDIVTVSEDDPPVLTALAAGTVTITATKSALSAQATVVVVAGPLASGSTRWAINGLFGNIASSLPANRVDLSVPDLFTVESGATGTIVRGVTATGDVQWVAQAPGYPLMSDAFGGIVTGVDPQPDNVAYVPWDNNETSYPRYKGLARFAGPIGTSPWRYDSIGSVQRPAQAPDGTIYVIEKYDTGLTDSHTSPIIETQIVVVDGATGMARAKIPLSREINGYSCGNEGYVVVPLTRGPVVGNDGYGYVLVRNSVNVRSGGCISGTVSQNVGVKLLRISPAGVVSSTTIYSQHCDHGFSNLTVCDKPPVLADLLPDGLGVLVRAGYTTQAISTYPKESRLTRVTTEGIQYDMLADFSELWMTDGAGRAYVSDSSGVRAVNVSDWTTAWSQANPSLRPAAPLLEGRVAMFDVTTNNVTEYGADGSAGQSATSDWYWGYLGNQTAFGLSTGVDGPTGGQLTSHISLPFNEANGSYLNRAVGTQQNAPRERTFTTREEAALRALDFLYPLSTNANWEYGGFICSRNGRFLWSRFVTDQNQSSVSLPANLCASDTKAARLHTHPPKENPEPSTDDITNANAAANIGIPSYLKAPIPNSPVFPPVQQRYLKYWHDGTRPAQSNICWRSSATWQPLGGSLLWPGSVDANCQTPNP